jgi:hypothetical protein
MENELLALVGLWIFAIFLGMGTHWAYQQWRRKSFQHLGAEIVRRAEIEAESLRQRLS